MVVVEGKLDKTLTKVISDYPSGDHECLPYSMTIQKLLRPFSLKRGVLTDIAVPNVAKQSLNSMHMSWIL